MNLDWLKIKTAWQPFTFGGVASFADAPLKRLLLIQFVLALLAASTVVWFLGRAWFPVVDQAIQQLPSTGEIRKGRWETTEESPRLLAEGRFLAIIADPHHTGKIRVPADLQVEAGMKSVRFIALLGFVDWPYPDRSRVIAINKLALEPWWGAWRPPLFWIVFGVVMLGLILTWWLLASLYSLPFWFAGFFSNRRLTLSGSWKMAAAGLMPGAMLMVVAILLHGWGVLGLVEFFAVLAAHWAAGIAYGCGALMARPKLHAQMVEAGNPFDPERDSKERNEHRKKTRNPFHP
jgi:hypothetical protein